MTPNIALQPTAIPLRGPSAAELKRWASQDRAGTTPHRSVIVHNLSGE